MDGWLVVGLSEIGIYRTGGLLSFSLPFFVYPGG